MGAISLKNRLILYIRSLNPLLFLQVYKYAEELKKTFGTSTFEIIDLKSLPFNKLIGKIDDNEDIEDKDELE